MNEAALRPVVVAVDGSAAAIAAAEWAATEAVHQGVPLRIVHVVQHTCSSTVATALDGAEQQYAEDCLRAACSAVRATNLAVSLDTAVLCGSVGTTLIGESSKARLICVGSSGVGRVASAVHGSTATTLTEHARCPVAIIRHDDDTPAPPHGIVVAILDGCSDDDAAMGWVLEEARLRHAPALALGVFPWPLFDVDDERFYDRLDRWLHRYPDVSVEIATTRLSAARYLETFVGAIQLVVVGHGDFDSITRLLGPRRLSILPHANCSVLVARTARQADHNDYSGQPASERSAI